MTSTDVAELYLALEAAGVQIWIDGGWGVDALLERQTRPHDDLDIALQSQDVPAFRAALEARGFHDAPREDATTWNFVLGDREGRRVDAHVVTFDALGNGVMGAPEEGLMYPAGALEGIGVIDGLQVRCVAADFALKFHLGYPPRPSDYADVRALCERFGFDCPADYASPSPR